MSKILSLAIGIFLFSTGFSQSNKFGTLNLSGGAGFGIYATSSEITATYFNGTVTLRDQDTSGAATTYGYLSGDFGILKFLSAGFYLQSGKYLQEEEQGVTKDNGFLKIGIMPKLYLVNNDKFNLNLGVGFGIENLKTSEKDNNSSSEGKYSGSNIHLRLGMNFYFTKSIGLFFHTGFDANNLNLKELNYTVGNNSYTPSNLSGNLKASGLEMAIGLNFKFSAGGN